MISCTYHRILFTGPKLVILRDMPFIWRHCGMEFLSMRVHSHKGLWYLSRLNLCALTWWSSILSARAVLYRDVLHPSRPTSKGNKFGFHLESFVEWKTVFARKIFQGNISVEGCGTMLLENVLSWVTMWGIEVTIARQMWQMDTSRNGVVIRGMTKTLPLWHKTPRRGGGALPWKHGMHTHIAKH